MTEITCSACGMEPNAIAVDATVGELNPNIEAMIVSEEGKEVAIGERGEFYVKGPNVMKGYWHKPDATKGTMTEDGWLKTGDIAYRNEEGFIYIVDRKKVS
jgi:4-coumarate--CoA ligase